MLLYGNNLKAIEAVVSGMAQLQLAVLLLIPEPEESFVTRSAAYNNVGVGIGNQVAKDLVDSSPD
jgi:hypothetical protein